MARHRRDERIDDQPPAQTDEPEGVAPAWTGPTRFLPIIDGPLVRPYVLGRDAEMSAEDFGWWVATGLWPR